MEYGVLLSVHVVGALATGLVAAYASYAMLLRKPYLYRGTALALAAFATFEVLTGVTLAVLSPTVTMVSLCGNIALYLAAVAVVEALLFMRMKKSLIGFPVIQTVSPVGASIVILLTGVALGL